MILKMNINMADTTEKIENSELVTNRDQLVVVDNIESLIKVIRGQQVIFDKDLGKKWFTFSKLDILSPDMLIEKIKSNN